MMEELMDLVLVAYHSYWFFSEVLWVVHIVRVPIFVCCVICADLPDASVGS